MLLRRTLILASFVLLPAAAAAAPVLTRGPYLQSVSSSSAIIRWRTDTPTASVVRYGAAPESEVSSVSDPALTTEHEIAVSGLAPDQRTYYSLESSAGPLLPASSTLWFRTSPLADSKRAIRLWVIGDAGRGNTGQLDVYRGYLSFAAAQGAADILLMLGDNAYESGRDSEYQARVFNVYGEVFRTMPLWPAFGNHDALSSSSARQSGPYFDSFSLPKNGEAGGTPSGTEAYYSFDYGPIHFVCLDSSDSRRGSDQAMADWLRRDLAATTQRWRIAFFHHPPYTKGSHDSDREVELIEMRENIVPILEDGGVDLVLTGHSHSYERSYLIDGHYGPSSTLLSSMFVSLRSGAAESGQEYAKPRTAAAHRGAVYVVAGNASAAGGGTLDHPIMRTSRADLGSLIIDVNGDDLRVALIGTSGAEIDAFTIRKNCFAEGACPLLPEAVVFPSSERTEIGARSGNLRVLQAVDGRGEILGTRRVGRSSSYSLSQRWDFSIPAGMGASVLSLVGSASRRLPVYAELAVASPGSDYRVVGFVRFDAGAAVPFTIPLPFQLTGASSVRLRFLSSGPRIDRLLQIKLDSLSLR